jgi:hypothetical protein
MHALDAQNPAFLNVVELGTSARPAEMWAAISSPAGPAAISSLDRSMPDCGGQWR